MTKNHLLAMQQKTVAQTIMSSTGFLFSMALIMLVATSPALAADLQGGFDKANEGATIIKTGLYALAGTGAIIYLLIKFLAAWRGRADWGELAEAFMWVAGAGSVIYFGPLAWKYFTS